MKAVLETLLQIGTSITGFRLNAAIALLGLFVAIAHTAMGIGIYITYPQAVVEAAKMIDHGLGLTVFLLGVGAFVPPKGEK